MDNVMNDTRSEVQALSFQPSNPIATIVIGTLVGAVAALLLAPKSGRQIRKDISKQAHLLSDRAQKMRNTAKKTARKQISMLQKQVDRAQKEIDRVHLPDLSKVTLQKRSNPAGKWIAGIAIGSALGTVATLLLTPKPGLQLRRQLRRETDDLAGRAANLAHEAANEARQRAKKMAAEISKD